MWILQAFAIGYRWTQRHYINLLVAPRQIEHEVLHLCRFERGYPIMREQVTNSEGVMAALPCVCRDTEVGNRPSDCPHVLQ